jgi:hypothetical protein
MDGRPTRTRPIAPHAKPLRNATLLRAYLDRTDPAQRPSLRALGARFKISHVRVSQIVKRELARRKAGAP